MMHQKVESIHQNPVEIGSVDKVTHWRYFSARHYEGETGRIDICQS
ncbi:hypothetical protein [Vibrio gazogenes]|nr:hypothetical protein [Vibrio gazogenes]